MTLEYVEIELDSRPLPAEIRDLLQRAEIRIEDYFKHQPRKRVPRFIASDFEAAYRMLQGIHDQKLAPGTAFCEWGSGFGIITIIAAMVGFDACGIEIEEQLVKESMALATDVKVDAKFICDSYIPAGFEYYTDEIGNTSALTRSIVLPSDWLRGTKMFENDIEIEDFDTIFTFPWPGEAELVDNLFELQAAEGALFMTYDETDGMHIQRKVYELDNEPEDDAGVF